MLDLIIRGGDVVTPQGVAKCDVAIKGETIAAVAAPGTLADAWRRHASSMSQARSSCRAVSILTFTCAIPSSSQTARLLITRGPDHVGMAALHGGTTTLIDFAYVHSDTSVRAAIESRDRDFVGASSCDWAYHLMMYTDPPHTLMGELGEAIEAGYPSVKIFMTNISPLRNIRMLDLGESGRCSRCSPSMAASASSTPRTTISSCTCTGS